MLVFLVLIYKSIKIGRGCFLEYSCTIIKFKTCKILGGGSQIGCRGLTNSSKMYAESFM